MSRIIRPTPDEVRRAEAAYRRTHWGKGGGRSAVAAGRAVDPRAGVLVTLGECTHVTYRTAKLGDGGEADYTHGFGKRPGKWVCVACGSDDVALSRAGDGPFPLLAYELEEGLLTFVGGGYAVKARGIVG